MPPRRKPKVYWCYCPQCGITGIARNEVDYMVHQIAMNQDQHPHIRLPVEEYRVPPSSNIRSAEETDASHLPFQERKRLRLEHNLQSLCEEAEVFEQDCVAIASDIVGSHTIPSETRIDNELPVPDELRTRLQALRNRAEEIPISYFGRTESNVAHILARARQLLTLYPDTNPTVYNSGM